MALMIGRSRRRRKCPSRRAGGVRLGGRGSSPSSSRSRWHPAPNPGPSLTGSTAAPTGGDDGAASPVTSPPAVATRARPLGRFRSPYPATLRTLTPEGSVIGFDSSVVPATLGMRRLATGSSQPSWEHAPIHVVRRRGAKVSATWPAGHTPRTLTRSAFLPRSGSPPVTTDAASGVPQAEALRPIRLADNPRSHCIDVDGTGPIRSPRDRRVKIALRAGNSRQLVASACY